MHILCFMSKSITISKLVETLKSHSSGFMKSLDNRLGNFYWQYGYAAFSVHTAKMETLVRYIRNQHEHHAKTPFEKEFIKFLDAHEVAFEQKYAFD